MALLTLILLVAHADADAPPPAPATEAAAVAAEAPPEEEPTELETAGSAVPFAIAGMSGAVALGSGAAALSISASIARSLDDAAAKRVPLTGYNARTAGFYVCAGLAVAAGVTAIVATTVGVIVE